MNVSLTILKIWGALSHRAFEKKVGETLGRCPFCGCKAQIVQWRDTLKPNATWAECVSSKCGVMTESYYNKDFARAAWEAIKVWNRRTVWGTNRRKK